MKSLLNANDRQEIISRINQLTPTSKAQWGLMDVAQMVTHCQLPIELALKNPKPARKLLGYILGPLAKGSVFGPKPYQRNEYTPSEFKISAPQIFAENKEKLLTLVDRFAQEMPHAGLVHPFFGPLPLEVWGQGQYKHLDHHLTQFGV